MFPYKIYSKLHWQSFGPLLDYRSGFEFVSYITVDSFIFIIFIIIIHYNIETKRIWIKRSLYRARIEEGDTRETVVGKWS
jgi:hypothetical protein